MDKGAHFYACDFQVHSPRDRDWVGNCPVTHDDRSAYAKDFVAACRAKSLNAVAITDHHDVAFVEYIREAALKEVLADGTPVAAFDRLVVFPGIELTLAIPCQALLLFDPECTATELKAALAILGIAPSADQDAKSCETERLAAHLTLGRICDDLSNNPTLAGRFILLPNVNDGGDDTLLRTGFAKHYIEMPCVGGYVDGSVQGHKKHLIISGKDTQWGLRKIGVLQTSDNRRADFANLGKYRTWVKWSKPSAEALRQASLAPSSRLAYTDPALPQNWIRKMTVSASRYFGPFTVEFNPQTNMVIGGRGSGKSTLLEYLRWGLCDQPVNASDDEGTEEVPNYQKRRSSLIKSTLQRSHGSVTIEYLMSGVVHTIRRDADTEKVFLTIEGTPEQEVSPAVIQGLARVQGYSQKQLSNVSVRNSELLRLVTSPIKAELDALQTSDKACASELRSIFQDKEQHRALSIQRANTATELSSKKSQIDSLTAEMKDLPADQKKAIDEHGSFTAGQRAVSSYTESVESAVHDIDASTQRIDQLRQELKPAENTEPNTSITALRDGALLALEAVRIGLLNVRDGLTLAQTSFGKFRDEASVGLSEHEQRYNAATSQNAAIQARLEQIKQTSSDMDALTTTLDEVDRRLTELGQVDDRFNEARERWKNLADEYFQLLTNQGSMLTSASKGELKVSVSKAKDTSNLVEHYTQTIQGSQVTRDKIERLISTVASNADPIKEWLDIVDELLSLIEAQKVSTIAVVPKMSSASIGTSELNRIANRVSATSAFELSLIRPETYPTFSYRMPDSSYIPFQDASPGQQANALLALLFGQAIGPLIIDQPEDDLDNATALQIAESIWTAKEKRQLIIASHNPNLVVIGDAELVLYCKHSKPTSGGSPVGIALQGGLDIRDVQDVVATVMEGGKDAFRLRMSRYGY